MLRGIFGKLAIGVVAAIVVGACGGSSDDADTPAGASGTADVTVRVALLDTMSFEPAAITVAPGDTVEVILTNKGSLPHNFSIEGLDVDVDVAAGETKTATFTAPGRPGEHKIYCNVVGHEGAGMVGALVVER